MNANAGPSAENVCMMPTMNKTTTSWFSYEQESEYRPTNIEWYIRIGNIVIQKCQTVVENCCSSNGVK
jgi:hypothetical protein